jgi:hypothetical protein
MPTFGSNDRSRWATVRALVDEGTYVIGKRDQVVMYRSLAANFAAQDPVQAAVLAQAGHYQRTKQSDSGVIFQDGWQSVDKVLHPATHEYYSSKPPLLATLIAGLYWLLQLLTGWTLDENPAEVVRTILLLVNALPFGLYLYVLARLGERYSGSHWSRMMVLAAAAFGTMATPFLVTLNNHTVATFCVLGALALALTVWERRAASPGERLDFSGADYLRFVAAGALAAFAVCNELPALAFWAALAGLFFLWSPPGTIVLFLPASLLVFAAYFFTNHQAIGEWLPVQSDFGSPWYDYEGSHWRPPEPGEQRSGIDYAYLRETRGEYALHLLVGHHGFFSLTPVWIIAVVGLAALWPRRPKPGWGEETGPAYSAPPWWLPLMTLAVTAAVIGFYLLKSNNYGGWTNGPRWLMWLSPLLLVCLYPVMDWLARDRWGRALAYLCLAFSILAANYRLWNPWRHPWLYDAMVWLGWPGY